MAPKHPTPPGAQNRPIWPYSSITNMMADVARNQWCKKIRGKRHSFGVLSDPKAALARYQAEGPSLHAGLDAQKVRTSAGLTMGELVSMYSASRAIDVRNGDLSERSLGDYIDAGNRLLAVFGAKRPIDGLGPIDFAKLRESFRVGPTRRGNLVIWCRQIFRWGHDSELCTLPRFGKSFKGSTAKERRVLKASQGANLYTADEVRRLILAAPPALRVMILLGLNVGLGNSDCANLTFAHLNLERGVGDYPRPKTHVERQLHLWPETIAAIQAWATVRPSPADPEHADLVFLTRYGRPWVRGKHDAVGPELRKVAIEIGIKTPVPRTRRAAGKPKPAPAKSRRLFYTLRHTFRTLADEAKDQHATFRLMGQVIAGMAGTYVEKIDPDRLRAVTEHVYGRLFHGWALGLDQRPGPDGRTVIVAPPPGNAAQDAAGGDKT
jgi:integrase